MNIKNIQSNAASTKARSRRGFTLVELLLVLTILAILAGVVLPNILGRVEQARITAAKVEIANLISALSMFDVDNGFFPKGADGLQALLVRPANAQSTWKGPYLQKDKIPLDPWGNPYIYETPGRHYPTSYDLYSKGKDGIGGTNAIGNWTPPTGK